MMLATTAALGQVRPDRRGLAGGIIFAGVGLGIVLSGALVPPLLEAGQPTTWHALGAGALAIAPAIDMLGGRRRVARAPGSAVSTPWEKRREKRTCRSRTSS